MILIQRLGPLLPCDFISKTNTMKNIKPYLSALLSCVTIFFSSGQKTDLAVPIFEECISKSDLNDCNQAQWIKFLEKGRDLVKNEIPYEFQDSVVFKFHVGVFGQIKIDQEIGFFSRKALDILKEHLYSLKGRLSKTNKGKNFIFSMKFDIPKNINAYPYLKNIKKFPVNRNCTDFNTKGQKACFKYLLFLINEEIDSKNRDLIKVDLYFKKGELQAMKFISPGMDLKYSDQILGIYRRLASKHLINHTKENSQNFKVKLEYHGHFSDSIRRRNYRFKKLEKLAKHGRIDWFSSELFDIAMYYFQSSPIRAKFILDQMEKFGFDHLSRVWNGFKFIEVEDLKIESTQDINLNSKELTKLKRPAVAKGCSGFEDIKEIEKCLNMYSSRFLAKNYKFPKEAIQKRMHGKIFISYIVEQDGEVSSIEINRSAGDLLDYEAIRVISIMEKFDEPSRIGYRVIREKYTLPINLKLN